jgi:hypothetical protein
MTDFDLTRLAEIPDPLAERAAPTPAGHPLRVVSWPASPTRGRLRTARAAALAMAVLFDAAWIAFIERRRDLASLPPESIALGLGIPLVAAVVALVAVVRPGARGLGMRLAELVALVGVPPLLFAFGTLVTSPAQGAQPFVGPALRCIGVSAILAAAPFVVGLLVMRRSFVSSAGWRTAALGVSSGALAAATMSVACANGDRLHVLVAHGAIVLFGGVAGAWAGARITRA